jgi:hypothetical protein
VNEVDDYASPGYTSMDLIFNKASDNSAAGISLYAKYLQLMLPNPRTFRIVDPIDCRVRETGTVRPLWHAAERKTGKESWCGAYLDT